MGGAVNEEGEVSKETIIEREIVKAIGVLDPAKGNFTTALQDDVRDRLAARATLGELDTRHTCPAGHVVGWHSVLVVVAREAHARCPLAFIQCPQCVDEGDVRKAPIEWAELRVSYATPHLRWIIGAAARRVDEIDKELKSAVGMKQLDLLRERKLASSIGARARLKLDEL